MRQVRRTFSIWKNVQSVWRQAFPDEHDIANKLQARRDDAKRQRELQEKILEGTAVADEHIPEWKRGAIILGDEKKLGVDEDDDDYEIKVRSKESLSSQLFARVRKNEELSNFKDEYSEAEFYREGMKENLANRVSNSDNVVLNAAEFVKDKVRERVGVEGALEMYRRDPNFDFLAFEEELKLIFIETYNKFTEQDTKFIEKSCGGDAFSSFTSQILVEQKSNLVRKCPGITHMLNFAINRSSLNKEAPLFVCSAKFYEINCLVNKDDPDKIVEGNPNSLTLKDFMVIFTQHPKPDVETTGHDWIIAVAMDLSKNLQLEAKKESENDEANKEHQEKEKNKAQDKQ